MSTSLHSPDATPDSTARAGTDPVGRATRIADCLDRVHRLDPNPSRLVDAVDSLNAEDLVVWVHRGLDEAGVEIPDNLDVKRTAASYARLLRRIGRTSLYRMYDKHDALLYIGITRRSGKRFDEHGNSKFWWRQVSTIKVEHFPNRRAALLAESYAIYHERPLHNIAGNS